MSYILSTKSARKAIYDGPKKLKRKKKSNMQNLPERKEPICSSHLSWKEQMVATSFTLNIRKYLAMLRKERTGIVKAGSGIANVF